MWHRVIHGHLFKNSQVLEKKGGKGSVPGWPDIVKQLYYQMALEKVVDGETVSNCFAFPAGRSSAQPFSSAQVFLSKDVPVDDFPEIGCIYIDILEVMKAYSGNRNLLPEEPA